MSKKFVKNYVGKGKKVKGMDIIQINIDVEEALKFQHEYNGRKYLSIEVSKLKEKDKFKRTHTCYISKLQDLPVEDEQEAPETTAAEKPGKGKRTRKTEPAEV